MEHYLVLSDDIDDTKRFYCEVLGVAEGFRPDLGFPGYWLYAGGTPCIHIAEWETYKVFAEEAGIPISTRGAGTGALDHIAFNAAGFDATVERLERLGIPMGSNVLDEIGLRHLYIRDPNGHVIELNFMEGATTRGE
jgi:catechol 2,3-dioxygenase-like lactoylglutathione lyase family enzyme